MLLVGDKSAVGVAGPVDGKLFYPVTLFHRPQDYLDIEHKSVGYAFAIQTAGDVAAVNLEAALRIGKFGGDFHYFYRKPVKKHRADMPVKPVVFYDVCPRHFAGPVCYVALAGL